MCTTRSPRPQPQSSEQKPPQYLTNPYLDSQLYRSTAIGRNALRIDPTGPAVKPPPRMSNPLPPSGQNGGGGPYLGSGGNNNLGFGGNGPGRGGRLRITP